MLETWVTKPDAGWEYLKWIEMNQTCLHSEGHQASSTVNLLMHFALLLPSQSFVLTEPVSVRSEASCWWEMHLRYIPIQFQYSDCKWYCWLTRALTKGWTGEWDASSFTPDASCQWLHTKPRGGQQDGKARHFLSKAQQSQSTSIERELRQREREREIGRWMDGSMDGGMDR